MPESIHSTLSRVRAPRVHISYDVETGGAIQLRELPFVMGVLGDFTGQPTEPTGYHRVVPEGNARLHAQLERRPSGERGGSP